MEQAGATPFRDRGKNCIRIRGARENNLSLCAHVFDSLGWRYSANSFRSAMFCSISCTVLLCFCQPKQNYRTVHLSKFADKPIQFSQIRLLLHIGKKIGH